MNYGSDHQRLITDPSKRRRRPLGPCVEKQIDDDDGDDDEIVNNRVYSDTKNPPIRHGDQQPINTEVFPRVVVLQSVVLASDFVVVKFSYICIHPAHL